MCCMALCATQKQYFMVPTSPGRNSKRLLLPNEVLTLMTGVQIRYSIAKYQGTPWGQREEGWSTIWPPGCGDLLSVCPLAGKRARPLDPPYCNSLSKGKCVSLFNPLRSTESMFWPRKWIHARILMICPSHTPMSTHLKKKTTTVYCTSLHFFKAWTML